MKTAIFTETQRFEFWNVLILVLVAALMFYCVKKYTAKSSTPANSTIGKAVLYACAALPVPVMILFLVMSLNTIVDNKGVSIKFSPFHSEWRTYPWDSIKSCTVKTYDPIGDYGGWGIRNGAYNVSGDKGLLLKFTNGSNLLIGTQKPEELKTIFQQLNKTQ